MVLLDDETKRSLLKVAAIAIAYHDIALWSDGALDYLEPSVAQLEKQQQQRQQQQQESASSLLTPDQVHMARQIILQHHKVTPYTESESTTWLLLAIVNAVRQADWADFTVGLVRNGMPASLLEVAYEQHPDAGFHALLLKDMGPRLSPNSLLGQLKVLRIFKW